MSTTPIKLYDHQKSGSRWLLSSQTRGELGGILADEMGLGKTGTALITARIHKEVDKDIQVIVIAPKSLGINWKKEAKLFKAQIDNVYTNHAASFPDAVQGKFILIVDEAHAFQELSSQRTKQFLALVTGKKLIKHETKNEQGKVINIRWEEVTTGSQAIAVYLLTGTPLKNGRPINLLPLLKAINHNLTTTPAKIKDYKETYCGPESVPTPRGIITTYNGATNLDELHTLTQPSILRRLTKDCIDLPELTRVIRAVDLTDDEQKAYDIKLHALKQEYQRRIAKGEIKSGGEKLVLLTQLRLVGSVSKVPATIEFSSEILEQGGQVVIFTEFRESADAIAQHYGVQAYTGDTSQTARNKIVEDFQAGKQKVFVGIGKAGGVGLTLHANGNCRNVILVDRPWTPGDAEQEEKRAHRIGQPNAVLASWLQHSTIDQTIDSILLDKKENSENVLSGERITFTFKSQAEIAEAVFDALGW
jgi:SNF2 family DNA or RNA helicase